MRSDRRPARPRRWRGQAAIALTATAFGAACLISGLALWRTSFPLIGWLAVVAAAFAGAMSVEEGRTLARATEDQAERRRAATATSVGMVVVLGAIASMVLRVR